MTTQQQQHWIDAVVEDEELTDARKIELLALAAREYWDHYQRWQSIAQSLEDSAAVEDPS